MRARVSLRSTVVLEDSLGLLGLLRESLATRLFHLRGLEGHPRVHAHHWVIVELGLTHRIDGFLRAYAPESLPGVLLPRKAG